MKCRASLSLLLALVELIMPVAVHAAADRVSFARDIVPQLRTHCTTCHMTGDEPGGLKLYPSAAYRSIVKMPSKGSPLLRVKPGQPQDSYLLHKLDGTHLEVGGAGVRMPFGQAPLAEETRSAIRRWILQGAHDN